MFQSITQSLLLRVGLIMAALTLLAVSSMVTSVFIGRTIQGEATAVNIAGSLRMHSYRIATQLLTADELEKRTHWQKMQGLLQAFERQLFSTELSSILPPQSDHEVRQTYERVKKQWEKEIRPVLDAYINGIIPSDTKPTLAPQNWGMISDESVAGLRAHYLSSVSRFVDHIDQFVKALSSDAEAKIQRLRRWQLGALLLTIAIVVFALFFSNRWVVLPLRTLLTSAGAAGHGDFSHRTSYTGKDELGRLGSAFNDMSERLDKLYADLEERVHIKTQNLERSNRSLDVLYKTVKRLSGTPFPHITYQELLEEITGLVGTGPAVICLTGDRHDKAHQLASTRPCHDPMTNCKTSDCGQCLGKGEIHFFDQPKKHERPRPIMSLPIKDARNHHGVLLVEALDDKGFADWQKPILQAVASHIGIAITMSGRHAEQNRLALLTERGAMARELHDSLAQSLSYAKIQVARLNHVLADSGDNSEARAINNELRDGLNRAYRELRELLTTFRLTMDDQDLNATIRATLTEFGQRGPVEIKFIGDSPNGLLNPNEEIHILQIIREALSNIVRHSGASSAKVALRFDEARLITLEIEDNGNGLDQGEMDLQHQHYGLTIMRERAQGLGGELIVDSKAGKGTRLSLSFMPLSACELAEHELSEREHRRQQREPKTSAKITGKSTTSSRNETSGVATL
ncbi:MAG: type IV pili methyl-accepting chemotaxis transducer N-terminal domain-containing protein [Hyphomicrobiaceae bacterium]|nr:type IV pili methyl-accepting chemotaxis transducer N-terminal domain-containing protein [Hyphomicrobiaceae bacterium]